MAFIPDEAIDRMTEISGAAFRVYAYFCRRRNARSGVCFPSLKTTAEDCGLSYAYASVVRNELLAKRWIELDERGSITPLVGYTEFNSCDDSNLENLNIDADTNLENLNTDLENLNTNLENLNPHIKELTNKDNQQKKPKSKSASPRSSAKRGTRLPEPFLLTKDMRDWANVNTPSVDAVYETEKFCNYFRSVAGSKGVKLDWLATWRNWLYREQEKHNGKNNFGATKQSNITKLADYDELFAKYD